VVTANAGESCDDGNTDNGDTCPSNCRYTPAQLAAGGHHSCALFKHGRVKCWGDNVYGQLGLGNTLDTGDEPDEMGPNLPAIDLGTGKTAKAISAGGDHTCAILNDDSIKCWGHNLHGRLGLGDTGNRGGQPNQISDNLPPTNLGTGKTTKAIDARTAHTCAILNDGSVKCWGNNSTGRLGLGDTYSRGNAPNQMGDNLPAVNLGTGEIALAIATGQSHTCAVLQDDVKCWGNNGPGQLGLGDTYWRGDQPGEMGDNLPAVLLY
jgi:cysteine-rich repeat protein